MRIIIHGKQAENEELRSAVEELRGTGREIEVRVTWDAGDGAQFARQARDEGVRTIVAAGGDGTLNEVVCGMLDGVTDHEKLPALGIVPLGTANDFARSTGLPLLPGDALKLIADSEATPIDIGRLGDRFFLNVATGGFGTQVTTETPEELKRVLGAAAYLLTGLQKFTSMTSCQGRFRGPEFAWEGNFLVLAVGNGRQAGGGHILCPEATISDGLLDVTIMPEIPSGELGKTFGDLLRNGIGGAESSVERARLPWLELDSQNELTINLDGESVTGTHFRFEAQPRALWVHLPPGCPLLASNAA